LYILRLHTYALLLIFITKGLCALLSREREREVMNLARPREIRTLKAKIILLNYLFRKYRTDVTWLKAKRTKLGL
jgi:hypothetical protein